ncbi:N-acetyl sugar amidotransferase [Hymenobacter sp. BT186]|uniref:N-acetyl sugar amidotransferase n=1 Tax=Hymenobacter telluris TaxID=2816474 RepID=A0A939JB69_9BACT|nr:N-acetyl sugar amidotransferase [Hymenobacter telluris]MBO0356488.1 N-acetyl sugar amidotransferase [Hymenobacter telluris]MBW3372512.1 N-acetyl sugar amidotransferase [Hymenobacter norwichensis]
MTQAYQRCTRCIMDTTVPGITFDAKGECNFCEVHNHMDKAFPLGEAGRQKVQELAADIKRLGKGKKYDCVLGVSGGRDSSFTLWYCVVKLGLRPLAVHFNDGFGNPVAGENMVKACQKLDVEMRTITSDWRESKDLKIAFLKASTPDMEEGTDVGIATALYGVAAKEGIQRIVIGQSFRTEGIAPLTWNYLDGKYLKAVHKRYGTVPLRPWKADDPGFHLDIPQMFYYAFVRRIKTVTLLYHVDYVRADVDQLLERELAWVNPGAHYFDDLYQSVIYYLNRTKFNIDRRLFNYSALVRSGQMPREVALEKVKHINGIEDEKVINLCIKRLGLTREEFEQIVKAPPKTFRDYPNNYSLIRKLRWPIKVLSQLNLIPESAYDKYFNCGT